MLYLNKLLIIGVYMTGTILMFTLRFLIFIMFVMLLTLIGVGLHERKVQKHAEALKKAIK